MIMRKHTVKNPLERMRTARPRSSSLYSSVTDTRDEALSAAAKMLVLLKKRVTDNIDGSIKGASAKPLHDLRVSLRRIRHLLKFFGPLLDKRSSNRILKGISDVCDEMGPMRDRQEWIVYLGKIQRKFGLTRDLQWNRYMNRQRKRLKGSAGVIRDILQGKRFSGVIGSLDDCLRKKPAYRTRVRFAVFAERRLHRYFKRFCDDETDIGGMTSRKMHELRRRARKMRYAAEFSEGVLCADVGDIRKDFDKLADALGVVHDLDVHVKSARSIPEPAFSCLRMQRIRRLEQAHRVIRKIGRSKAHLLKMLAESK